MPDGDRQRIDKWLWFARVTRTRTGAQKLVVAGRVRVNRERTGSANRLIKPGDVLTIGLDSGVRVLRVIAPGERRGPAADARGLYDDLSPPPLRGSVAASAAGPRPTKRDRRAIDALRTAAGSDFPAVDD
jgi:ribosome-associated heat shock protein Hsp15